MKIAIFTEGFYRGGVDTFITNLISEWIKFDVNIILIINETNPSLKTYKQNYKGNSKVVIRTYNFITYNSLQERLIPVIGKFARVFVLLKYMMMFLNCLCLYLLFKTIDANNLLVVNGGYPAAESCRLTSIVWGIVKKNPSVHSFHSQAQMARKSITFIENLIDILVNKYTKFFISVSRSCADSIRVRKYINEDKVTFIYNGIKDQSKEYYIPLKKKTGKNCVILSTLHPYKGHLFLIDVFKIVVNTIPDAKLFIYGNGHPDQLQVIEKKIEDLNLNSNIIINSFSNDPFSVIASARVLVVPSRSYESFGLTCIEAMSLKVPVVVSSTGGLPEVVLNNQGGKCIPVDDKEGFAEAIIRFLTDDFYNNQQGQLGYKRFKENFTSQKMAKKYLELFT